MTERFTNHLHRTAQPIWHAQHMHPFVHGIGDGSLDLDKFAYWVRQDYRFLTDYARLFAVAASRAPNLELMLRFIELANSTLTTEMSLHRAYAEKFNISREESESERASPTTQAYTDFLLRIATFGSFGELAAALLPCMWGYSEIGQELTTRAQPKDARYAEFIEMYASPKFAQLANWCRELVEHLAEIASEDGRKRME